MPILLLFLRIDVKEDIPLQWRQKIHKFYRPAGVIEKGSSGIFTPKMTYVWKKSELFHFSNLFLVANCSAFHLCFDTIPKTKYDVGFNHFETKVSGTREHQTKS